MSSKLTLTILKANANIRSASNSNAGIIGVATAGQQFEIIQILDAPSSREQWARIDLPDVADAYICTRLCDGTVMASGSMVACVDETPDYIRGWNACLDAMHLSLVTMRKHGRES